MDNFKWGVIGPGHIAEKFARDVKSTNNSELFAVASRSGADEYVAQFNVPVVYDSYEAIVADPEVDGIYIATPHRFHFEHAKLSLDAGKPVLCEKPLTVNAKETRLLVEIAREKNLFLMEALWSRFLPGYRQVRQWLDDGEIGEVLMIRSAYCFQVKRDVEKRWLNPELAGGSLLDLGIYSIAISQWIMQANPESIQAIAVLGETGVDERLSVQMQYPSGAISQFVTSFEFAKKNEMIIQGSKGAIRIPEQFLEARTVILEKGERRTKKDLHFRSEGFEYEIEEVVRCIRAGEIESADMSHSDTIANMEVMDDIRAEIGLIYPFE